MKMTKTNPTYRHKQGMKNKIQKYDTNRSAQRARLLAWLKEKPITTLEARKHLDIMAPAPRVFELRHDDDYNIVTDWSDGQTELGITHRIARYILLPGRYQGGQHG